MDRGCEEDNKLANIDVNKCLQIFYGEKNVLEMFF